MRSFRSDPLAVTGLNKNLDDRHLERERPTCIAEAERLQAAESKDLTHLGPLPDQTLSS